MTAIAVGFFVLAAALIVVMTVREIGAVELPLFTAIVGAGFAFFARRSWRKDNGTTVRELNPPLANVISSANPYERILLLGGAAAILVGAIAGFSAASANSDSEQTNRLTVALGGMQFYDPAAGTEYSGWVTFGVVFAVIGVALLVVFVSIRASRQPRAD